MAERIQMNLSFTGEDPTYASILKLAEDFKIEPTKAARLALIQRIVLLEDGWEIKDDRRFLIMRVVSHLSDKGLNQLEAFIRKTFAKEVALKAEDDRPRPMVIF